MANNTVRIAAIRAILEAGVSTIMIGGEQVSYDFDTLRRELRRLEQEDDTAKKRRPSVSRIELGNW